MLTWNIEEISTLEYDEGLVYNSNKIVSMCD